MKSLTGLLWISLLPFSAAFVYPKLRRSPVSMSAADDISQDLNAIYKYKSFFEKESYASLVQDLEGGHISKMLINANFKELVSASSENTDSVMSYYHLTELNPILVNKLVDMGTSAHIPLYFVDFTPPAISYIQGLANTVLNGVGYIFPILLIFSIIRSIQIMRGEGGAGGMPTTQIRPGGRSKKNSASNGGFGQGQNGFNPFGWNVDETVADFVNPNVSISSWLGNPEVIDECRELISYLEQKEAYAAIGAEMPRGILLEGPPGTGKTLLAKAIATETNSTFISMSGSEFVELFVGMGAARVRELFETARDNRPCIIFIDEIDAIGRQRGAGINMGNDEREQTLNQLLYEMDGFNDNEDIVIMAATNRKDVLDAALLRPGRFDRILRVPLPDRDSRIKILEYYLKSKPVERAFDLESIAELTDGFSGAELKNVVNEAAILSARNNYTAIQEVFIFDAFEKSVVGLIRKNATISSATQERVAIHETGHALLVLALSDAFDFQKVSIQPTYNGAGGYTLFSEKAEIREGGLYTKDLLKQRLIITMGGKAAETIFYGEENVSLGAIQDLQQANQLAKRMVGNYGMGTQLEVFFNEGSGDDSALFLGRTMAMGGGAQYSEMTKTIFDQETLDLVKEAYETAKEYLLENNDMLIQFAEHLKEKKVLYAKDIEAKYGVDN